MKHLLLILMMAGSVSAQTFTRSLAFLGNANPRSSTVPYDSVTMIWSNNAVQLNSGTLSSNVIWTWNEFVVAEKAAGRWNYLMSFAPFSGGETNAAVALLKPLAYATNVNLHGITSAEYSTGSGFINNSSHWIDFGAAESNATESAVGMGVWATQPMVVGDSSVLFGHTAAPSGNSLYLGEYFSGSTYNISAGIYGAALDSDRLTLGAGMLGISSVDATHHYVYQNGEVIHTFGAGSSGANPQLMVLFGVYHYYAGAPVNFLTNTPIGCAWIDLGMPTNMIPGFFTNVALAMQRLGRTYQSTPQKVVLIVGQSLACVGMSPAYQPMPTNTVLPLFTGGSLVQGNEADNTWYPRSGRSYWIDRSVTTGWRAAGDHLNYLLTNNGFASERILILNWARNGSGYSVLKKGSSTTFTFNGVTTNIYAFSVADFQAQDAMQVKLTGQHLNLIGLVSAHGETDNAAEVGYEIDLNQWLQDYRSDLMGVTGQTNLPTLFSFQPSSLGYPAVSTTLPYATMGMQSAQSNSGGSNKVAAARYNLIHDADNTHLPARSYQMQGEEAFTKVFEEAWNTNRGTSLAWTNVAISGNDVTLTYPLESLKFDGVTMSNKTDYGFTIYTNNVKIPLTAVVIQGATSNQVKLTALVNPSGGYVTYALNVTNASPNPGPFGNGTGGNLRDQYATVGFITTSNLYNWGIIQRQVIP